MGNTLGNPAPKTPGKTLARDRYSKFCVEVRNSMCQERKELEQLVLSCIRAMSYHSMAASKLARNLHLSRPADFEILRREYSTASVRLRALCECLEIHRRRHGCMATAPRPGPAFLHSLESPDHLQKRTPGAKHRSDGQKKVGLRALKIKIARTKRRKNQKPELPEATAD